MVAARLATMKQGARTDFAQICAKSQREAADRLNVSRRLVQYADDLQDKGVLEWQNAVDDDKSAGFTRRAGGHATARYPANDCVKCIYGRKAGQGL